MNLLEFSKALYATPISTGIRETTGIIPTTQSIHILAIAVVVGSALVMELRLAGMLATDESPQSVVRRYLPWLWAAIAEKYLSPQYTQHTIHIPGPGTDREKLIHMFQNSPAAPPPGGKPMPRQRTDAVMAEGDKVMLLTSRDMPDPVTGVAKPSYIFNMFRVQDGKLVEHWDVSSGMGGPPPGGPPGAPGAPGTPPAR